MKKVEQLTTFGRKDLDRPTSSIRQFSIDILVPIKFAWENLLNLLNNIIYQSIFMILSYIQ